MIAYLENKAIYVKNDDKLVYKVISMEIYDGYNSLRLNLKLVCGWDYINPDENDVQGWCKAENFNEDVQDEQEICYIMEESVKECLEANGYEILEKCPIEL
jgi:hypothetical protein